MTLLKQAFDCKNYPLLLSNIAARVVICSFLLAILNTQANPFVVGGFLINPGSDKSNVIVSHGFPIPLPASETDTSPRTELALQSKLSPASNINPINTTTATPTTTTTTTTTTPTSLPASAMGMVGASQVFAPAKIPLEIRSIPEKLPDPAPIPVIAPATVINFGDVTSVEKSPAALLPAQQAVQTFPVKVAGPKSIDINPSTGPLMSGRSLIDVFNQALANDPLFRAAIKDHEANTANLMIGRSAVLPKLSASANMSTNKLTNTSTGSVSQTYDNYPSSNNYIQILQPLFDLGSFAKYRQGMYQKDYGDAKFQADTYELLARVTQSYLEVLYSEDLISYLTSQRDSYLGQMNAADKSFRYGDMSKIDYLEAKSAYENSLYQLLEAEQQSRDSRRKLGVFIGESDISSIKINKLRTGKQYIPKLPANFQQLLDIAQNQNYSFIAAQHKLSYSKEEINKSSANFYPQVNAIANWSRQNSFSVNTVNLISNQTLAGVQVSWPLFSSGETLGQTRQAVALYEKSKEEYEGLKLNTGVDLEKFYDQIHLFGSKIQILENTLEALQESKKATVYGVAAGIRSNVDVLLAIKNIFNTQKDLAQARYSYINSCVKVLQLSGLLKIDDLENISSIYFSRAPLTSLDQSGPRALNIKSRP